MLAEALPRLPKLRRLVMWGDDPLPAAVGWDALLAAGAERRRRRGGGPAGRRRPRRPLADHLHVGHDQPPQGRGPQPHLAAQPGRAGRAAGPQLQRRAPQLPAAVPRLRLLGGGGHGGADRRPPDPHRHLRRRRGARPRRGRGRHDPARLRHPLGRPHPGPGGPSPPAVPPPRDAGRRHGELDADRLPQPGGVLPHGLGLGHERGVGVRVVQPPDPQRRAALRGVGLPDGRHGVPPHRSGDRRRTWRPASRGSCCSGATRGCRSTTASPRRPPRPSTPTAGSTPGTWCASGPTATSCSWAATRTC